MVSRRHPAPVGARSRRVAHDAGVPLKVPGAVPKQPTLPGLARGLGGMRQGVDGLDDIVEEFLVESHENLDQLDQDLVALEQDPNSRERLSSIFRTIHTIKGTSGFLAFNRLEEVAHVGENLLSRLRDGALELTPARTDALLRMVDTIRELLGAIESSGGEGTADVAATVAVISAALEEAPAAAPAAEAPSVGTP